MPFDQLGLDEDATERDVRRAYAVRLKKTRPDDDPVAFQALHEAYQACLDELRFRRESNDAFDDENGSESPPGDVTPTEAPAPPGPRFAATVVPETDSDYAPPTVEEVLSAAMNGADGDAFEDGDTYDAGDGYDASEGFNLTAFLQALFEQCDTATPAELEAWLNQQPELYSISLKSVLTVPVLRAVVAREPALRPPMLDAVAHFFGASQLGRHDWWLVEQLDQAKARARAVEQFTAGRLPRANPQERHREFDDVIDRHIARRRWRWTSPLLMLVPGVPSRIRNRIDELDHLTEGATLDLVDPRLRRVAGVLSDRSRVGWQRVALTWSRALAFGFPLLAFLAVVTHEFNPRSLLWLSALALAFTGWQLLIAAYLAAKTAVTSRGHGHRWRETLAAIVLALALATPVVAALPLWVGIMLALVGSFIAAGAQRFEAWFSMTLCSGAAVAFFSALDLFPLPLPPALVALSFPGLLALAVDRLQARITGRHVDEVATSHRWLLIAGAVCLALLVLALVLVAAS